MTSATPTDPAMPRDERAREQRTQSRWRRRLAVASVVALAALAAIWGWRHFFAAGPAAIPPAAPIAVTTATVREQDVAVFRSGVGAVIAPQSVTVKVRVDGQLQRVDFVEGQDVKAGQLLAEIDPRPIQAQLDQMLAQRARDQAQLGNARTDLGRFTNLLAQEAATQQQVDTQKSLVAQLEAAVKTDEAQINFQQVQLGYTRIAAPIAGRTGARLVDAGNIVHAADTTGLVVINQIDPVAVLFTLPEEDFQDVNRALQQSTQPLQVSAYPRNGQVPLGSGRLTLLNNQIDTATGTVQMKALFANPGHALWPGQYVNVRLVLGHDAHALTVPASAIQRSQSGQFVWVVDPDNKARDQAVEVDSTQDDIAVIRRGLQANQRVVIAGQYKVRAGVAVAEAARPAASSASGTVRAPIAASGAAASGRRPLP
jgi:multidrug efflux system membrane fusion protein